MRKDPDCMFIYHISIEYLFEEDLMKYHVRIIHPMYGEVKVLPDVIDAFQLDKLYDFARKHDEIIIVEEVNEE